ncbi:MAG: ADP-ribose pyrophosphatase, partial [Candidatus Omnitrophota bacterium]
GYSCKKITKIGYIYPACGYTTEKIIIYKAEQLEKHCMRLEQDEIIETHIFTKQKIKEFLKSGKIVDAKTICALSMCGISFPIGVIG